MTSRSLVVIAPVSGRVVDLAEVDDPVFSAGLVGPGIAITPDADEGGVVVAPFSGTIVKLHPHAFVITHESGRAVLVHLGINTVQLGGEGFALHVAQGDVVDQGTVLVTWDPAAVQLGGRSPVCPVVALEGTPDAVAQLVPSGAAVGRGAELLGWQW